MFEPIELQGVNLFLNIKNHKLAINLVSFLFFVHCSVGVQTYFPDKSHEAKLAGCELV